MSDSQTKEVKELKHELERIDKGGKDECVMCRFVLIFAFIVLLLVLTFTFFFRMENSRSAGATKPTPPEEVPMATTEEYNTRIMELGHTMGYQLPPPVIPQETPKL